MHRDIALRFDYATTDSLRTALSFGCRSLHFSGHGHPQYLNFEDGRSGLQLVNVDMLSSLLGAGGLRLDFVFVSACHSRKTGEAFIAAGVPHVVCVKVNAMVSRRHWRLFFVHVSLLPFFFFFIFYYYLFFQRVLFSFP